VAADSLNRQALATVSFTALIAPPTIIAQPPNLTVNTGSSADFKVTATNVASYQWQLVGTGTIAGATNATLALDDVSASQSGSAYQVVLTAPDGETITSAPAVLTVVPGTIVQLTISKFSYGSSSNLLIQLFDHDKPATVQNFIHYITSGAFSNTFFDRDVAGFVLQGGDYVTVDRTTNGLTGGPVSTGTDRFPSQVDNEFNVGPIIHNTFGTLAMALQSGNPNSASSAFFFNLGDNSTNLDNQNGGFTVFGRILSGTNILQYFNSLSAPGNGIFDLNSTIPTLPVNYDSTNPPTDASLFYADFSFLTPPPVDTTPPTVSIAFPGPNAAFTNGSPLTVQGTAQDNVGLAEVYCVLRSLTGAYGGQSQTNTALGTTDWSLDLVSQIGTIEPGIYQLTAFAQDGAGNLSAPATVYFTNLAALTVITNVSGQLTDAAPQYLVPGRQYFVTAAPGPGQQFYSWTSNGVTSLNPVQTFTATGNITLTVTYLVTNASSGLAITSPISGRQSLSIQSVLTVSGTIASANVTNLTCQFFVNSNAVSATLPASIVGTNWMLLVTNFANGPYTVVALATDATGAGSDASASFTLLNVERLTINIVGGGTVVSNPGPYVVPGTYTVKAVPDAGQSFYSWSDAVTTTLNPFRTFQILSNLTLTATFVSNSAALKGITFAYPPANGSLTNGTFNIAGGLPSSLVITQMMCQLFLQSNGVTALPQPAAFDLTAKKWSFPVTNLAPGTYSALVVASDNRGEIRLVSENFTLLAKLQAVAQPANAGTVTAGLNGKYLQVGKAYSISATPKSGQLFIGWTGAVASANSASTTFVMSSNTVLTANFTTNLFPAVAGTYTGVFLNPDGVSPTNSGFVTVTTTGTGSFTGQVKFPAITFPIEWTFDYTGFIELQGRVLGSNYLQLVLNLDLTNGTDTITGFVVDQPVFAPYVWSNSLVLHRSVARLAASNAPVAGKYVALLQPAGTATNPVAAGYAAVSLGANGALSLVGALPDNTAISESSSISKAGIWPVYIVPSSYNGKGVIIGWQTNTPAGACDGQLFWCKPTVGVAESLTSTGSVFEAPTAGTHYRMVLPGGTTNFLTVNASRQFAASSPILRISLQPTGLLSGLINVNDHQLSFKGAFISPSAGASGFIINTNGGTDGFLILPEP
jgi:cyclophilin family peptidyl-prolyl cis-trans isomerase